MPTMPSEPSDSSHPAGPSGLKPPPPTTPRGPLTDGRPLWDWPSKYPFAAWIRISAEGLYVIAVLGLSLYLLYYVWLAHIELPSRAPANGIAPEAWRKLLIWKTVGLGGVAGGCAFALKWHYHSVAYGKWHADRLIWRIVVPILGGVIALFTALIVGSGFIPIFSKTIFDGPEVGAAFGFFVGFFSDNLLATLQRKADQIFGTLERSQKIPNLPQEGKPSNDTAPKSET